ncbi:glycosyltransferase involved in cell wall biosynthesis [Ochrobactrum daejeonense]|uniref:Glycosyltransferase involved in cell wall biosynthesis n=1 Tax=Brucella daejeonensis TaxID=659015 RepID=A0A7W9B112_9HYPH|nr:DUF3800 domain-containing protein [Brucella daejeonensis]MBB5704273.1 glycosyltransferase involved in cell wall biosynthesis [Brucella daejeonensis]
MLVFIDESGDPGFKIAKGSSDHFAVALVAFKDVDQSVRTIKAISDLARGLRSYSEFKFSRSRPEIRDAFFEAVSPFDFCVRAIVIRKEDLYSQKLRTDKSSFYSFFVKSMLKFDNGLLKDAKVVIDGSGERSFRNELAAYLRKHTGEGSIKKVIFSDSKNDRLIQLADMCVGAIARSYSPEKKDADRWMRKLSPKIEDVWNFR